jgi:hypothetical protein
MGEYEVELTESQTGTWSGVVFHSADGDRSKIGETSDQIMKTEAVEEARRIAKLHKDGPEVVKLEL